MNQLTAFQLIQKKLNQKPQKPSAFKNCLFSTLHPAGTLK